MAGDIVKGAVAGAVATRVMEQVTTYLYELEDEAVRRQEAQVSDKPPYRVAAEKIAALAGLSLTEEQLNTAGQALHRGLGVGAEAVYGVLRRRVPGADAAQGLVFGLGFFLLIDEWMNTTLGFAKPPECHPWQAHARGLTGYLVYGVVADTGLDLLDRASLGGSSKRRADDRLPGQDRRASEAN